MVIWTLNGTEIKNPNSYDEEQDFIGTMNTTLLGTKRRAVRAVKRVITVSWTNLSNDEYQTIYQLFLTQDPNSVYYTGTPLTLTTDAGELGISSLFVHMDLGPRRVIPATDFLSETSATFYEV